MMASDLAMTLPGSDLSCLVTWACVCLGYFSSPKQNTYLLWVVLFSLEMMVLGIGVWDIWKQILPVQSEAKESFKYPFSVFCVTWSPALFIIRPTCSLVFPLLCMHVLSLKVGFTSLLLPGSLQKSTTRTSHFVGFPSNTNPQVFNKSCTKFMAEFWAFKVCLCRLKFCHACLPC